MHLVQRTLARPVRCSGIGMHSGQPVALYIKPAPVNHGIKFVRIDLPDRPEIAALFNRVVDTSLATVIGHNGAIVSTIEHLMASFAGLSIDNALVELDAYEMPIMDGSAAQFTTSLKEAGIVDQNHPRCFFVVNKPIEIEQEGKFVGVYPAERFKITCTIDFKHPRINRQACTLELNDEVFEKEISRARTFGFFHEIEYLKKYGFAKGGSLENAVVMDEKNILNPGGLRYQDEFVRHKVLDCIGDFSLLGMPIIGHIIANKSGHAFNQAFINEFFTRKDAWDTRQFAERKAGEERLSKSLAN